MMTLNQEVHAAFVAAIKSVGLVNFKKCSFFMSNDKEGKN